MSLPHVRGGVSKATVYFGQVRESSPRAWGCFLHLDCSAFRQRVFPTCVGVFLPEDFGKVYTSSLPHVRGGVSG